MTALVLLVGGCTADDDGTTAPVQGTEPGAPIEDPSALDAQDPPGATELPPVEQTEG